jgi:hypothetical protein
MTIEIVDFPIKNGGSFHSYVNVYQRVNLSSKDWNFTINPMESPWLRIMRFCRLVVIRSYAAVIGW